MVTEGSDFVILIRTEINIEEYEGNVKGFLIYLSDEQNILKLLKTLGMGTNND
jgi:chemotaxis protein CheC